MSSFFPPRCRGVSFNGKYDKHVFDRLPGFFSPWFETFANRPGRSSSVFVVPTVRSVRSFVCFFHDRRKDDVTRKVWSRARPSRFARNRIPPSPSIGRTTQTLRRTHMQRSPIIARRQRRGGIRFVRVEYPRAVARF